MSKKSKEKAQIEPIGEISAKVVLDENGDEVVYIERIAGMSQAEADSPAVTKPEPKQLGFFRKEDMCCVAEVIARIMFNPKPDNPRYIVLGSDEYGKFIKRLQEINKQQEMNDE